MKACILTIYDYNLGNRLQNLAVQEFLKQKGCEVVKTLGPLLPEKKATIRNKLAHILKTPFSIPKKISKKIYYKIEGFDRKRVYAYKEFNRNIDFFTYPFNMQTDLSPLNNYFDLFVTGSDQVFNTNFFGNDLKNYMLGFANGKKKKIALAPSFGTTVFSEELIKNCRRYLPSFNGLSCREKSGSEFLERILGKKVETLIDPTLLFDKEFYRRYEKEYRPAINEKYIYIYSLGGINKERLDKVKKIAKDNGLKIIETFRDYGPSEFIYLVDHAQWVITDSFHGTVFSIIFNKPLSIFRRSTKGTVDMFTRFDSLFSLLNEPIEKYSFDLALNSPEFSISILPKPNLSSSINKERKVFNEYFDNSMN